MQHSKVSIYDKARIAIAGTVWVAGLLVAGSDSSHMPWINGVGLLLFFLASLALVKLLKEPQSSSSMVIFQKLYPKRQAAGKPAGRNSRVRVRYAMDAR